MTFSPGKSVFSRSPSVFFLHVFHEGTFRDERFCGPGDFLVIQPVKNLGIDSHHEKSPADFFIGVDPFTTPVPLLVH